MIDLTEGVLSEFAERACHDFEIGDAYYVIDINRLAYPHGECRQMQMSDFAHSIMAGRYAQHKHETWSQIARRVAVAVLGAVGLGPNHSDVRAVERLIEERKFMPGGRYLYASGRPYHQTQNCLLLRAEDTREGWGDLVRSATLASMTGAGFGVNYSDLRPENAPLGRSGGTSSGPLALMQMVNEIGRGARQGGARRGAIWAGLLWSHPDAMKFVHVKDWPAQVCALKASDFNFPATLDYTNVSVTLDDAFFEAYHDTAHPLHSQAQAVYWSTVRSMVTTGEPGFSVDTGANARENLRNACTEVTSEDDSDICNLGSINLARIETIDELRDAVRLGTLFLMAGTVYSDVPYSKVADVRDKNRRLGLGLMGIHEWLLTRGQRYEPNGSLGLWLSEYEQADRYAAEHSERFGISRPVKTRAIAPNGTIGIVAETTTSAEPVFCVAYKRRYRDGNTWHYQYVVDPTAKRLIDSGVDPDQIEDAYSLSQDVERRVAFQAWLQGYVDHAISSTVNLPSWGSQHNNEGTVQAFGDMLIRYLPRLRGITAYPDGARGGQPLTAVSYDEAAGNVGNVFVEGADICDITKGGGCG